MSDTIINNIRDIIKASCESFLSHITEEGFDESREFEEYYKDFSEHNCSTRILRMMKAVQQLENMLPSEQKQEKKKRTKTKIDVNKPKKPLNAYLIFCKENQKIIREENPELGAKDIMKKMGEIWKSLDADEKNKYNNKASLDKDRYQEEVKDYIPNSSEENVEKKDTKVEKTKRAPTAYNNFCKEKTKELKQLHPERKSSDNLKEASRMWKELNDEEKERYKNPTNKEENKSTPPLPKSKIETSKPQKIMKKIIRSETEEDNDNDLVEKNEKKTDKTKVSKPKKIMKKLSPQKNVVDEESDDELVDE